MVYNYASINHSESLWSTFKCQYFSGDIYMFFFYLGRLLFRSSSILFFRFSVLCCYFHVYIYLSIFLKDFRRKSWQRLTESSVFFTKKYTESLALLCCEYLYQITMWNYLKHTIWSSEQITFVKSVSQKESDKYHMTLWFLLVYPVNFLKNNEIWFNCLMKER